MLCNEENLQYFDSEVYECASQEEIWEYFLNTIIEVNFVTGTNYIDFKDIDSPMKKSTSLIGDRVDITSLYKSKTK